MGVGSRESGVGKVSVVNLGCKVNQSEGEDLLNGFTAAGFEVAKRGEPADVIVVNTCTVTNEADRKSRKAIYRACGIASSQTPRDDGPARPLVVVTGCYAAVAADDLRKIEGVCLVVPQGEKGTLVEKVQRRAETGEHTHRLPRTKKVRAFLKVQDGCDNRCAYCIVPDARGNPVSVPVEEVLANARQLVAAGAAELVLAGINIGKFGKGARSGEHGAEKTVSLDELVKELFKTEGLKRLRISSIEPEDVTLDLIGLFSVPGSPRPAPYLCGHLHIPLQSGDRRVLQRMGRRYMPSDYLRLINSIRHACPDAAITTDVIVGFPGETDQEFANTMTLLTQVKPSKIHVFKYSKRAGTPAADMPDQVSEDVKNKRSAAVRGFGDRLSAEYRASFAGRELDVLVEREKDGLLVGTTENYLSVSLKGDGGLVGTIVKTVPD